MSNDPLIIRTRNGSSFIETIPGAGFLKFLYGNVIGTLPLWSLVKRKVFSQWFGKYMDNPASAKRIASFVNQFEIDLSEYEVPSRGFKHFNDFFYRKIRSGKRPLKDGLVSPADGRIVVFNELKDGQKFYVKGKPFDLQTFLGDPDLARKFDGGGMAVIRLAPVDYHRYHFPATGTVKSMKLINGYYYSVSPLALRKNWEIFWENKRWVTVLQTEEFGEIALIDVAATCTGGMVQTHGLSEEVWKGQERGYFKFGGSTVVVLTEPGKVTWEADLLQNSREGFETYIKMGETMAR